MTEWNSVACIIFLTDCRGLLAVHGYKKALTTKEKTGFQQSIEYILKIAVTTKKNGEKSQINPKILVIFFSNWLRAEIKIEKHAI